MDKKINIIVLWFKYLSIPQKILLIITNLICSFIFIFLKLDYSILSFKDDILTMMLAILIGFNLTALSVIYSSLSKKERTEKIKNTGTLGMTLIVYFNSIPIWLSITYLFLVTLNMVIPISSLPIYFIISSYLLLNIFLCFSYSLILIFRFLKY